MKQVAFSIFLLMILVGCNNGSADKKDDSIKTDSLTQEIKDVVPVVDPAINNTPTPGPKCFENDGLKYRTIVNLVYLSPTDLSGNIAVVEYGKKLVDKQRFYGTVKGNEITVKFMTRPPKIGDASEWIDKPWTLKSSVGPETLTILIKAKNSETNEWAETPYEFKACTPVTK